MFSRLQQYQRVSIKLNRPKGRILGMALVIFILMLGLAEILARTNLVQRFVPFQAFGSNHIQFEIQLNKFKTFVAQKGKPDCLILGTSQSLRSIDPKIFSQTYLDQTGNNIRCYNFSVVGATLETTYRLGEILVNQIHPQLLIIGTSFLDYTESRDQRNDLRFEDNAWMAYQLGTLSLKGWLLEHSYAYRVLTLVSYGAPYGLDYTNVLKEVKKWKGQLSDSGYGYTAKAIKLSKTLSPGYLKDYLDSFGNFTVPVRDLGNLENLIEFTQQNNGQVILVEMPYTSMMLELRNNQGKLLPVNTQINQFVTDINTNLTSIANSHNMPFWTTGQLDFIPDNGWLDWYHLNGTSSPLFSQWLAQKVVSAIQNGQIKDPDSIN
jgi:hypothetical protein